MLATKQKDVLRMPASRGLLVRASSPVQHQSAQVSPPPLSQVCPNGNTPKVTCPEYRDSQRPEGNFLLVCVIAMGACIELLSPGRKPERVCPQQAEQGQIFSPNLYLPAV